MEEIGTSRVSPYCSLEDYEVECDIQYLRSVERRLSSIELRQLSTYRDNCSVCEWILRHLDRVRVVTCKEYSTYYKYSSLSLRLEWRDLSGRFVVVYGAGELYSLLFERSIGEVLEWSYANLEFIPVVLDGICSYGVYINAVSVMPVETLGRNILKSRDERILKYLSESGCSIYEDMLYYVYSLGKGRISIEEGRDVGCL